jgi:hypothetical protein
VVKHAPGPCALIGLLTDDLEKIRCDKSSSGSFSPEVLSELRKSSTDESRLRAYIIGRTWAGIGSRIQFTAQDVADRARLDLGVANAFLGYFSVSFLADGEAELP